MRETPLSNNEKAFVEKAVLESLRVDKRNLDEFRDLNITFGLDWGCVLVSLGETRVLAQVSCEVGTPKTSRKNEGTLFVNLEFGPMAAPHLETGFPLSESCIQISRTLERTLRDSRCVDLESLCIIAESKVWNLRVDLNVLNHEGNVMDCASIAAISSLAHFKRPDVSSGNNEFIIHTAAEKAFIPTVIHHYPVSISFALFNEGKIAVADPTALEERVSDATLVFAINSFKEVCAMHLGGSTLTSPALIFRCSSKAADRAKRIVDFIKNTLEEDAKNRETGDVKGFSDCIRLSRIPSKAQKEESVERMDEDRDVVQINGNSSKTEDKSEIIKLDSNTVTSKKDLEKFVVLDNSSEDSSEPEQKIAKLEIQPKKKSKSKKSKPSQKMEDSEDEETVVLTNLDP